MTENFTDNNPSAEIQRIIREATEASTMTELLRLQMAREREPVEQPQQQPPPASEPRQESGPVRASQAHIRVVYPFQNARMEITGMSEADLDEIEKRVRAQFPKQ